MAALGLHQEHPLVVVVRQGQQAMVTMQQVPPMLKAVAARQVLAAQVEMKV